FSARFRRIPTC
ncbi:cyclic nucleotide-binding domain protein, partial [Vibrio parahaemolyticus V-223/04]